MIPSRLSTIPAAEMARVLNDDGLWKKRVEVRRRGEVAYTDMTAVAGEDWTVAITTKGVTVDSPVEQFAIHFLSRNHLGRSTAPGITNDPFNQVAGVFKPFLHADSEVRVTVANTTYPSGTLVYRHWLEGVIEDVEWPEDDVVCLCNSLDYVVEDTSIKYEEVRGAPDPGTPLETEIQGLVTRWMQDPVTLYVYGDPGFGIGEYKPAVGKLGEQARTLARRIAWEVRYVYWDNAYRYTLFEPPRDKTTPDLYIAPDMVRQVESLKESGKDIRNDFTATAKDATGRIFTRQRTTVYPVNTPSYRRRWMGMTLLEDGAMTEAQVDALLLAAEQDLALPLAEYRVRLPFVPYLSLYDLLDFDPDDVRFDTSTQWAVVGVSHTVNATEHYTEVDLRGGGVVGQHEAWLIRRGSISDTDPTSRNLYDYVGEGSPTGENWTWKRGPSVHTVWGASGTFDLPEKRADYDAVKASREPILDDTLFIPYPPAGKYSIAYVESYDSLLRRGEPWKRIVLGTPPEVRVQLAEFPESADGTQASMHLELIDPRGVITGINVYLINVGVETGPFAATLVAPLTWEYGPYSLHPDHPVGIRLEGPRNDGQPAWAYGPFYSDTNKVPRKPDVRLIELGGPNYTAYVDSPDTDAASHFYRVVTAGVEGPDVPIAPRASDPRFGAYNVTASETDEIVHHVYAKSAANVVSDDYFDLRVPVYVPLGDYGGPALDVSAVSGPVEYTIYWAGDPSTQLSINGGAYATPPASPITVTRPAAGATPLEYTFRAERNGIAHTNLVTIAAIDQDTVTPDLDVDQTAANTNNATQGFTATASNPRTAASLPVTVRLIGCTGTNNGVALAADTDATVAGPIVVNRPAFGDGNGAVKFTASIPGGGREEVVITIPAIQQGGTAVRLVTSETATTGTLTLVPVTGVEFTKIETATKVGTGATSAYAEIVAPPYTTNVALVEKHVSLILYRVYKGTTILQEGTQPFDVGDVANVTIASVTPNGAGTGTASVVVNGDSDTFVGVGGVKYRVAGGTLQNATVGTDRSATFNVPQAATIQTCEVWGYNDALAQGPVARGEIPAGEPEVVSATPAYDGDQASVTVRVNSFAWTGTGAGRYRIDGGTATLFDVGSDRMGQFTFTRSETAAQLVEIAASTQAGAWGAWFPLTVEKYVPFAPAVASVKASVEDEGAGLNDVYTVTVTGTSMDGLYLDVQFYRSGVQVGTSSFLLTDDTENIVTWNHVGAGDGVSQNHYVVVQLYNNATDTNYGAPTPSRVLPSFI